MKKLILAALFLPTLALAEKPTFEICQSYSTYAETVMEGRQLGVDMASAYEMVKDEKLLSTILMSAYDSPRYSTQVVKDNAISDFKNKWFLACIQSK